MKEGKLFKLNLVPVLVLLGTMLLIPIIGLGENPILRRIPSFSDGGWISPGQHDETYVRLPRGVEYLLATFRAADGSHWNVIPFFSQTRAEKVMPIKPEPATLILRNGRLWTGNKSKPWAEAIAVAGDRIIAVGSDAEVGKLITQQTQTIDLQAKLLVPGFIDGHTHFIRSGFHLLSVNLRDAATQKEFAHRIEKKAQQLGPNRWITGGDWDHELWPGAPLPTKELIDAYTERNPVFVNRLDGHMALVNSVALRLAKITKASKDPPGGTIVRDPTGEPTGILKDGAMGLVRSLIPESTPADYDEALRAAQREAAQVGVTSIQDITPWHDYEVYQRFRRAGQLTVRVYARTPMSDWRRQATRVAQQGRGDEWLRLGGLKAFMDGSLGSTTALFFEPYNDAPNTSGISLDDNLPEGKLKQNIQQADRVGLQCAIHAIGDKANHLLLNYYEAVARENGPRDRRFRIEHAQHLLPSDIPRFGQLGVIPSMQPYHAIDDGRWAEKRIGRVRIKTTYAFRALLDSGATLVFGSDWSVAPLSPIQGIYAAVTRRTLDGKNPGGWVPEQKITVEEALRAYTRSAAHAEFSEREKGTLEPGKLADMVVLAKDIFRINASEIPTTNIVYTIVGGRIVYGNK